MGKQEVLMPATPSKNISNLNRLAEGRTAEVFAWEAGKIIKVYRPGFPAEDARYEADVAVNVQESGVACPHFFGMTEVDERPGLIYEKIEGIPMLELVTKSPWRVPALARQMAALHIQMHQPFISADLPTQRGKYTWRIEHTPSLSGNLKPALLGQFARLPDERRLCHGDFHPANVMVSGTRSVTIDWIDVSVGHPMADVARTSVILLGAAATLRNPLFGFVVRWFHSIYLKEYFKSDGDLTLYQAFFPIVAAARMAEGITELQDWLLAQAQKVG
jgi:uncharacterized protein (TIGR02172 family)